MPQREHDIQAEPHSRLMRPLQLMIRIVVRRPRTILGLALITAVVSVIYSMNHLEFRTSRLDLLNPRSEFNRRWIEYLAEFQHEDDVILVVQAASPDRLLKAVDALARRLRSESHLYRDFFYRVDLSNLRSKGLYFVDDSKLALLETWVTHSNGILRHDWSRQQLVAQIGMWQTWVEAHPPWVSTDPNASNSPVAPSAHASKVNQSEIQRLPPTTDAKSEQPLAAAPLGNDNPNLPNLGPTIELELNALAAHLEGSDTTGIGIGDGNWLREFDRLGVRYLESTDGNHGYILVRLGNIQSGEFTRGRNSIERLQAIQRDMRTSFPDVTFGLTGLPVMELDEMLTSQSDMTITTIVSLVAVAFVFVIGFGTLSLPLLSMLAILVATAWSFAGVTLFVGHLNILSVSFNVILIGLGIDFGIHFLAKYGQLRQTGLPSAASAEQTIRASGTAIITGGVTTALAFGTAYFTDFIGVAELGVVAAQGIIACLIAQLTVLPALLVLVDRQTERRVIHLIPAEQISNSLLRHPRTVVVLLTVTCIGLTLGISHLWYDHNLLNLQADGVESVEWERKLVQDNEESAWYAISLSHDPQEIESRKQAFMNLKTVQRCEEVVSLHPVTSASQQQRVRWIHDQLAQLPTEIPQLAVTPRETLVTSLHQFATATRQNMPTVAWIDSLQRVQIALQGISNADYYQRITSYQQQRMTQQVQQLTALRELANSEPPTWSDLPDELLQRFIGKNGTHLLKIYARGSVWDMDALRDFVEEVEQIDPAVTGQPIQTYYASHQMRDSYLWAAGYSVLVVFITIFLDFRNARETCLAMLPVVIGLSLLLGVMGWFNIPLNPANMIVLPLLFGMGVDDGVHLVHNFRGQTGRYRLDRSTGAAVLLTSLTTIASFGSLLLARHQGLRSLGLVLTLGMATSLVASMAVLPLILSRIASQRVRGILSTNESDMNEGDTDKSDTDKGDTERQSKPERLTSSSSIQIRT